VATTIHFRPVCFASGGDAPPDPAPLCLRLAAHEAETLARLLPVFMCGEESAALAFAHLARADPVSTMRTALERIMREEQAHEQLLQSLRAALPAPEPDRSLVRATRRLFAGMADRDPARHFARIAALDSAVCTLLGTLRRAGGLIAREPALRNLFTRIHRDEVGHVLIARDQARRLGDAVEIRATAAATRERLTTLLGAHADAIENMGVDAGGLLARIRRVPRGLFP
jgi:rubrerythrin